MRRGWGCCRYPLAPRPPFSGGQKRETGRCLRRPSSDEQNVENAPNAPIPFVWNSSRIGRRIDRRVDCRIRCNSCGIEVAWSLRKGTKGMKSEDIMAVIENRD